MTKEDLKTKLEELTRAKKEAIDAGNIEKASIIREVEKQIKEQLDELNNPL